MTHNLNSNSEITKLKQVEEELYESEKLISTIFESTADGLLAISASRNVIRANKKFRDMWGISSEMVEKGKDKELLSFVCNKILESEKFMRDVERLYGSFEESLDIIYLNSGNIFERYSSPLVLDDKIVGRVWSFRDITEIKKTAEDLEELAIELKHKNEELEQFAYVASHDLQEPLRVVSSYCQLLKEKCHKCKNVDNETKKWLNYTIDATDRMKTLIKELLDFSRIGRKDKPFEKVDLNEIVEEVKDDFKFLIKETNTTIIVEEKLPYINCIRFRIKQLIYNLISNSIKFRGEKAPLINISFCEEKEKWLFCIKDNGIGIDSKYYDRIFEIFKRLYSREEYPGTGIGLALCKKIIETHNGKIWVNSVVSKGSSFYFSLPKSTYIN